MLDYKKDHYLLSICNSHVSRVASWTYVYFKCICSRSSIHTQEIYVSQLGMIKEILHKTSHLYISSATYGAENPPDRQYTGLIRIFLTSRLQTSRKISMFMSSNGCPPCCQISIYSGRFSRHFESVTPTGRIICNSCGQIRRQTHEQTYSVSGLESHVPVRCQHKYMPTRTCNGHHPKCIHNNV